jgi:hypothetical protein
MCLLKFSLFGYSPLVNIDLPLVNIDSPDFSSTDLLYAISIDYQGGAQNF